VTVPGRDFVAQVNLFGMAAFCNRVLVHDRDAGLR